MAGDGAISAQLSGESVAKLVRETRAFSPALAARLRKRLRAAGDVAAEQVRRTLREPTPGGAGLVAGGVRDDLADGTKVSILTGKRMQGVRITTSAAAVEPARRAVAKAYNKRSWRHPNWGRNQWSEEQGRPYFGSTIVHDLPAIRGQVAAALVETINQVRE